MAINNIILDSSFSSANTIIKESITIEQIWILMLVNILNNKFLIDLIIFFLLEPTFYTNIINEIWWKVHVIKPEYKFKKSYHALPPDLKLDASIELRLIKLVASKIAIQMLKRRAIDLCTSNCIHILRNKIIYYIPYSPLN